MLNAKDLSKYTGIDLHTVYRVTRNLQKKGFICISRSYNNPIIYQAVPTELALEKYIALKTKEFTELKVACINSVVNSNTNISRESEMMYIQSQNEIESKVLELTSHSIGEILVMLSESISKELIFSFKQAIKRGVRMKFLLSKEAIDLQDFLRVKCKMRTIPNFKFDLVVFDASSVLIRFGDQAVLMNTIALSKVFRVFFNSLFK